MLVTGASVRQTSKANAMESYRTASVFSKLHNYHYMTRPTGRHFVYFYEFEVLILFLHRCCCNVCNIMPCWLSYNVSAIRHIIIFIQCAMIYFEYQDISLPWHSPRLFRNQNFSLYPGSWINCCIVSFSLLLIGSYEVQRKSKMVLYSISLWQSCNNQLLCLIWEHLKWTGHHTGAWIKCGYHWFSFIEVHSLQLKIY